MGLDEEFAEPSAARRLRGAYTGRHDVTDAVWWRSHPLEPGPSGAPSSAADAARLARLVFSRDGADSATVVAHAAAELQLEADRRDIDEAIARARAAASEQEPEPEPVFEPVPEPDPSTGDEPEPGRRSPRTLAIAAIAAIVVAAVTGIWVGTQIPPAAAPTTVVTSGSYTSPAFTVSHGTPTAAPHVSVEIFDRLQITTGQASDVPDLLDNAITDFDSSSFRRVQEVQEFADLGSGALFADAKTVAVVYAARTTSNRACLVAVRKKQILASACAVESEFPANGVQLSFGVANSLYIIDLPRNGTPNGYSGTSR